MTRGAAPNTAKPMSSYVCSYPQGIKQPLSVSSRTPTTLTPLPYSTSLQNSQAKSHINRANQTHSGGKYSSLALGDLSTTSGINLGCIKEEGCGSRLRHLAKARQHLAFITHHALRLGSPQTSPSQRGSASLLPQSQAIFSPPRHLLNGHLHSVCPYKLNSPPVTHGAIKWSWPLFAFFCGREVTPVTEPPSQTHRGAAVGTG